MGRILALNPPFQGLSSIVNVLQKVGPRETNSPDDVKVVQQLLQMASKGQAFATSVGVPATTGRFDAATGFWIFFVQSSLSKHGLSGEVVDGIVSPARGSHYGPSGVWTIVLFNQFANLHDPAGYQRFVASQT
jgi:hypothetical protein